MYFRPIFDLFYPHPAKPTFDLFLTYFNVFGISGLLGGLLLLNTKHKRQGPLRHRAPTLRQGILVLQQVIALSRECTSALRLRRNWRLSAPPGPVAAQ